MLLGNLSKIVAKSVKEILIKKSFRNFFLLEAENHYNKVITIIILLEFFKRFASCMLPKILQRFMNYSKNSPWHSFAIFFSTDPCRSFSKVSSRNASIDSFIKPVLNFFPDCSMRYIKISYRTSSTDCMGWGGVWLGDN